MAPRGNHLSGSNRPKPGPTLQASLRMDMAVTVFEEIATVGSKNNYAASEHQGSRAHLIRSRGGKLLTFQWERGALLLHARSGRRGRPRRSMYFRFEQVNHPGNKRPVRYLTTPMHLYGRKNGFRTSSTSVSRSRLP